MLTVAARMPFIPDTTVPVRPATTGPETLFVSSFVSSGSLGTKPVDAPSIFHEPRLPVGFPDIVAVYLRDAEIMLNPSRNGLHDEHLRLLHHVTTVGRTSLDEIQSDLRWRSNVLRRCITDLEDADLLYVRGQRITPRPLRTVFAVRKIVAIEAKLDNWSRGIRQALSNTWFASHSYLLIPKIKNLAAVNAEAHAVGVGVMVFDGQNTETTVEPKKQSIPASYGSWLFNEWTIRRLFSRPNA